MLKPLGLGSGLSAIWDSDYLRERLEAFCGLSALTAELPQMRITVLLRPEHRPSKP